MKEHRITIIIDEDLKQQVKELAVKNKLTLTEVVTKLLTRWVAKR